MIERDFNNNNKINIKVHINFNININNQNHLYNNPNKYIKDLVIVKFLLININ